MPISGRKVLVLDDDQLLASLIASLLEAHDFITHTANDVSSAMKIVRSEELDVALVDINLGAGPSGIQFATSLVKSQPGVGVVFLTRTPDLAAVGIDPKSLPEGSGVAGKDNLEDGKELLDAIESVLSHHQPIRHDATNRTPISTLTAHQLAVLKDVATGLTNKAIATKNDTTERSVERTLQAIFTKLDIEQTGQVNPRVEAIRLYIEFVGLPARPK